jgi:predicted ATPase/DNA-binding CsgD family transcriptional regulator
LGKKIQYKLPQRKQEQHLPGAHVLHIPSAQMFVVSSGVALVGREQEVNRLSALLQQPMNRLITLCGPGGVGKTQLVLAVGDTCSALFTDGVGFVSLASITTVELVIASIAHALGIKERREVLSLAMVKMALRDKEFLLILDNFEQVLEAAPLLTELLKACPGLKLLVTSRAVLRVQGEYRFLVAPLELPDLEQLPEHQALSQVPSVSLFVQRAQSVRVDFRLTEANARAVAEICVLLDGLPLALELAAARMKLFTAQRLLTRLKESMVLLGQGLRDAPERQQTLLEAMQWSYQLLTAEEQRLFRRLCVFSDGCTLEAAEAIGRHGTSHEHDRALNMIASLIDQSLLHMQVAREDEEPRLMLLETLRLYGLELLKQSGEEEEIREVHARYYLAYAEEAEPKLMSTEQALWFQRLDLERENIRSVLNWFIASGNGEAALRLNSSIWLFWAQLHLAEGYQWMERSFVLSQESATTVDLSVQAHAHKIAASLAYYMGNWQQMSMHLDQCVQLFQCIDDKAGLAVARNTQALLAFEQEDYTALPELVEEALALKQNINVPWFIAETLYIASMLAYIQKDYLRASELGREALIYGRKMGEPTALGLCLNALGLFAYARGEEETAYTYYYEALKVIGLLEKADARSIKIVLLLGLAGIAARQKNYLWATQLWGAIESLREGVEGTIGDMRRQWLNATARRQSNYEQMVKIGRTQLGEQVFLDAWNEGKTMTIDQLLDVQERSLLFPANLPQEEHPANKPVAALPLTAREVEVLCLVAQGYTSAQIAEQLVITTLTVNSHVRSIYTKLGITTRAAATRYAIEQQLL